MDPNVQGTVEESIQQPVENAQDNTQGDSLLSAMQKDRDIRRIAEDYGKVKMDEKGNESFFFQVDKGQSFMDNLERYKEQKKQYNLETYGSETDPNERDSETLSGLKTYERVELATIPTSDYAFGDLEKKDLLLPGSDPLIYAQQKYDRQTGWQIAGGAAVSFFSQAAAGLMDYFETKNPEEIFNTLQGRAEKFEEDEESWWDIAKDWLRKERAVTYIQSNPYEKGKWDGAFWGNFVKNQGTTAGILLGTLLEFTLLGKVAKKIKAAGALAKLGKVGHGLGKVSSFISSSGIGALGMGVWAGMGEGVMNAREAGEKVYHELIQRGYSKEEANRIAREVMRENFKTDVLPLMLINGVQYAALNIVGNLVRAGKASANAARVFNQAENAARVSAATGFGVSHIAGGIGSVIAGKVRNKLAKKGVNFVFQGLSEGVEEVWQTGVNKLVTNKYLAREGFDAQRNFDEKFFNDDEILASFMGGVIGGTIVGSVPKAFSIPSRIQQKRTQKKMEALTESINDRLYKNIAELEKAQKNGDTARAEAIQRDIEYTSMMSLLHADRIRQRTDGFESRIRMLEALYEAATSSNPKDFEKIEALGISREYVLENTKKQIEEIQRVRDTYVDYMVKTKNNSDLSGYLTGLHYSDNLIDKSSKRIRDEILQNLPENIRGEAGQRYLEESLNTLSYLESERQRINEEFKDRPDELKEKQKEWQDLANRQLIRDYGRLNGWSEIEIEEAILKDDGTGGFSLLEQTLGENGSKLLGLQSTLKHLNNEKIKIKSEITKWSDPKNYKAFEAYRLRETIHSENSSLEELVYVKRRIEKMKSKEFSAEELRILERRIEEKKEEQLQEEKKKGGRPKEEPRQSKMDAEENPEESAAQSQTAQNQQQVSASTNQTNVPASNLGSSSTSTTAAAPVQEWENEKSEFFLSSPIKNNKGVTFQTKTKQRRYDSAYRVYRIDGNTAYAVVDEQTLQRAKTPEELDRLTGRIVDVQGQAAIPVKYVRTVKPVVLKKEKNGQWVVEERGVIEISDTPFNNASAPAAPAQATPPQSVPTSSESSQAQVPPSIRGKTPITHYRESFTNETGTVLTNELRNEDPSYYLFPVYRGDGDTKLVGLNETAFKNITTERQLEILVRGTFTIEGKVNLPAKYVRLVKPARVEVDKNGEMRVVEKGVIEVSDTPFTNPNSSPTPASTPVASGTVQTQPAAQSTPTQQTTPSQPVGERPDWETLPTISYLSRKTGNKFLKEVGSPRVDSVYEIYKIENGVAYARVRKQGVIDAQNRNDLRALVNNVVEMDGDDEVRIVDVKTGKPVKLMRDAEGNWEVIEKGVMIISDEMIPSTANKKANTQGNVAVSQTPSQSTPSPSPQAQYDSSGVFQIPEDGGDVVVDEESLNDSLYSESELSKPMDRELSRITGNILAAASAAEALTLQHVRESRQENTSNSPQISPEAQPTSGAAEAIQSQQENHNGSAATERRGVDISDNDSLFSIQPTPEEEARAVSSGPVQSVEERLEVLIEDCVARLRQTNPNAGFSEMMKEVISQNEREAQRVFHKLYRVWNRISEKDPNRYPPHAKNEIDTIRETFSPVSALIVGFSQAVTDEQVAQDNWEAQRAMDRSAEANMSQPQAREEPDVRTAEVIEDNESATEESQIEGQTPQGEIELSRRYDKTVEGKDWDGRTSETEGKVHLDMASHRQNRGNDVSETNADRVYDLNTDNQYRVDFAEVCSPEAVKVGTRLIARIPQDAATITIPIYDRNGKFVTHTKWGNFEETMQQLRKEGKVDFTDSEISELRDDYRPMALYTQDGRCVGSVKQTYWYNSYNVQGNAQMDGDTVIALGRANTQKIRKEVAEAARRGEEVVVQVTGKKGGSLQRTHNGKLRPLSEVAPQARLGVVNSDGNVVTADGVIHLAGNQNIHHSPELGNSSAVGTVVDVREGTAEGELVVLRTKPSQVDPTAANSIAFATLINLAYTSILASGNNGQNQALLRDVLAQMGFDQKLIAQVDVWAEAIKKTMGIDVRTPQGIKQYVNCFLNAETETEIGGDSASSVTKLWNSLIQPITANKGGVPQFVFKVINGNIIYGITNVENLTEEQRKKLPLWGIGKGGFTSVNKYTYQNIIKYLKEKHPEKSDAEINRMAITRLKSQLNRMSYFLRNIQGDVSLEQMKRDGNLVLFEADSGKGINTEEPQVRSSQNYQEYLKTRYNSDVVSTQVTDSRGNRVSITMYNPSVTYNLEGTVKVQETLYQSEESPAEQKKEERPSMARRRLVARMIARKLNEEKPLTKAEMDFFHMPENRRMISTERLRLDQERINNKTVKEKADAQLRGEILTPAEGIEDSNVGIVPEEELGETTVHKALARVRSDVNISDRRSEHKERRESRREERRKNVEKKEAEKKAREAQALAQRELNQMYTDIKASLSNKTERQRFYELLDKRSWTLPELANLAHQLRIHSADIPLLLEFLAKHGKTIRKISQKEGKSKAEVLKFMLDSGKWKFEYTRVEEGAMVEEEQKVEEKAEPSPVMRSVEERITQQEEVFKEGDNIYTAVDESQRASAILRDAFQMLYRLQSAQHGASLEFLRSMAKALVSEGILTPSQVETLFIDRVNPTEREEGFSQAEVNELANSVAQQFISLYRNGIGELSQQELNKAVAAEVAMKVREINHRVEQMKSAIDLMLKSNKITAHEKAVLSNLHNMLDNHVSLLTEHGTELVERLTEKTQELVMSNFGVRRNTQVQPGMDAQQVLEEWEAEGQQERNYSLSSAEENHRKTLSLPLRVMLSSVQQLDQNGKPMHTIFGEPLFVPLDHVLSAIEEAIGVHDNVSANIHEVINRLKAAGNRFPFLSTVVEQLEANIAAGNMEIPNMFGYHFSKHILRSKRMQTVENKRTGEITHTVQDASVRDLSHSILNEWIDGIKRAVFMRQVEEGTYVISVAKAESVLNVLKELAEINPGKDANGKPLSQFTEKQIQKRLQKLQKVLRSCGITVSMGTLQHLVKHGIDGKVQANPTELYRRLFAANANTKSPIGGLMRYLATVIHEGKAHKMAEVAYVKGSNTDIMRHNTTRLRALAEIEMGNRSTVRTRSFRDGDKTLNGFTKSSMVHDVHNKLMNETDENGNPINTFFETIRSFAYNSKSLLLKSRDRLSAATRSKIAVEHVANNAMHVRGRRRRKNRGYTDLSHGEQLVYRFGLLHGDNFSLVTDVDGNPMYTETGGLRMRMVRTIFPTVSDKGTGLIYNGLGVEVSRESFIVNSDGTISFAEVNRDAAGEQDPLLFVTQQLIAPELDRVISMATRRQQGQINVDQFGEASKLIWSIPAVNAITVTIEEGGGKKEVSFMGQLNADPSSITPQMRAEFEAKAKEIVEQFLLEEVERKMKLMQESGILYEHNGIIRLKLDKRAIGRFQRNADGTVNSVEAIARMLAMELTINEVVGMQEQHMLYIGDPALFAKVKEVKFPTGQEGVTYFNELGVKMDGNLVKRMAQLIAPGNRLANSENASVKHYNQIVMEDTLSISDNFAYMAGILYGEEAKAHAEKLLAELNEPTITSTRMQEIHGILAEKYPTIAPYLSNAQTDGQEYTTAREHVEILFRQGRMSQAMYNRVVEKLDAQMRWEHANPNKPIPQSKVAEWYLTKEELGIVMQPIKPVYNGVVLDTDLGVARTMYVKTSSFPLIPQLTAGLELDHLRRMMEGVQIDTGRMTRAVYHSGMKVGAPANRLVVFDRNGKFVATREQVNAAMVVLDRSFFRIQQDVPYEAHKDVSILSQIQKLLFSNGVLRMDGFQYNGVEMTGEELYEEYQHVFSELIDLHAQQLLEEMGMSPDGTIPESNRKIFVEKLHAKLLEEAKARGFSEAEIEGLRLDEVWHKDQSVGVTFRLPLFLSPHMKTYVSLLHSMVLKGVSGFRMPGYAFVVGSEAGMQVQESVEGLSNAAQSRIIYFDSYSGKLESSGTYEDKQPPYPYSRINREDTALRLGSVVTIKGSTEEFVVVAHDKKKGRVQLLIDKGRSGESGKYESNILEIKESQVTVVGGYPNIKLTGKKVSGDYLLTDSGLAISLGKGSFSILDNEGGSTKLYKAIYEQAPRIMTQEEQERFEKEKAERETQLKKTQVLIPSKFRDSKGNLISFFNPDGSPNETYVYRDKSGRLRMKEGMIDPELLSITTCRIPTGSHTSASQVEIVGFLPPECGDLMIVPAGTTTKKGLDFDIDKETTYMLHTHVDPETGKIQPLEKGLTPSTKVTRKLRIKQLENALVRIHSAVLSNPNPDMQALLVKPLSMGFAKEQRKAIRKLQSQRADSQNSGVFSHLSSTHQSGKRESGQVGKTAIGAYASSNVVNAQLQMLDKPARVRVKVGKGRSEHLEELNVGFGNVKSDGTIGLERAIPATKKAESRSLNEVLDENLNMATDNAKEQLLTELGVNAFTLSSHLGMIMLGFDQAVVKINGQNQTMSIPYLLLSQPIVRKFCNLMAEEGSSVGQGKGMHDVLNQLTALIPEEVWDQVLYNGERARIKRKKKGDLKNYPISLLNALEKVHDSKVISELLDPQNLADSLSGVNTDQAVQAASILMMLAMKDVSGILSERQKLFSMQTKGVGQSYTDYLIALDQYRSMQRQAEVENPMGRNSGETLFSPKYNSKGDINGLDQAFGRFDENGNLVQGTVTGTIVHTALNILSTIYSNLMVTHTNSMHQVAEMIVSASNVSNSPSKRMELFEKVMGDIGKMIFAAPKLYRSIYGSSHALTAEQLRTELMHDIPSMDVNGEEIPGNQSLASYLEAEVAEDTPMGRLLRDNPFLQQLQRVKDTNVPYGEPHVQRITRRDVLGAQASMEHIYNGMRDLYQNDYALPDRNGKPYTSRMLVKDLLAYSLLEGGRQESGQFLDMFPPDILEDNGFYENLSMLNVQGEELFGFVQKLLSYENQGNALRFYDQFFLQHVEYTTRVVPASFKGDAYKYRTLEESDASGLPRGSVELVSKPDHAKDLPTPIFIHVQNSSNGSIMLYEKYLDPSKDPDLVTTYVPVGYATSGGVSRYTTVDKNRKPPKPQEYIEESTKPIEIKEQGVSGESTVENEIEGEVIETTDKAGKTTADNAGVERAVEQQVADTVEQAQAEIEQEKLQEKPLEILKESTAEEALLEAMGIEDIRQRVEASLLRDNPSLGVIKSLLDSGAFKDVKVVYLSNASFSEKFNSVAVAQYTDSQKTIYVNADRMAKMDESVRYQTIAHECIHSATASIINEYVEEKPGGVIEIKEGAPSSVHALVSLFTEVRQAIGLNKINEFRERLKGGGVITQEDAHITYGALSMHEFVALVMTDPKFQEEMAKRDSRLVRGASLLDRLLDILRSMYEEFYSIPSGSITYQAISNVIKLTEEMRGDRMGIESRAYNRAMENDADSKFFTELRELERTTQEVETSTIFASAQIGETTADVSIEDATFGSEEFATLEEDLAEYPSDSLFMIAPAERISLQSQHEVLSQIRALRGNAIFSDIANVNLTDKLNC